MKQTATRTSQIGKVIWSLLLVVFLLGMSLVVLSARSEAQQSDLTQQIHESPCEEDADCEMTAPSIDTISKNGGRPVFSGSYDSIHSQGLRITFGSRVYLLNVDDEITTQASQWLFDLSYLSPPLLPGDYQLLVETIDSEGRVAQISMIISFAESDIDLEDDEEEADPADTSRPVPGVPNTGLMRDHTVPIVMVSVGVSALILLVTVLRRKRA